MHRNGFWRQSHRTGAASAVARDRAACGDPPPRLPVAKRAKRRSPARRSTTSSPPIRTFSRAWRARRSSGATAHAWRPTTAQAPNRSKPGSQHPDIEDMLQQHYPAGAEALAASCKRRSGTSAERGVLRQDVWRLPRGRCGASISSRSCGCRRRPSSRLLVTGVNGVDAKLAAVSAELDELPSSFDPYLIACRGNL